MFNKLITDNKHLSNKEQMRVAFEGVTDAATIARLGDSVDGFARAFTKIHMTAHEQNNVIDFRQAFNVQTTNDLTTKFISTLADFSNAEVTIANYDASVHGAVTTGLDEKIIIVKNTTNTYSISQQEIQQTQLLPDVKSSFERKFAAGNKASNTFLNKTAFLGSTKDKLEGLKTFDGITEITDLAGAATAWTGSATAQQIFDDLTRIVNNVRIDSNGAFIANKLLIPMTLLPAFSKLFANTGISVMDKIIAGGLENITKDSMIFVPEHLDIIMNNNDAGIVAFASHAHMDGSEVTNVFHELMAYQIHSSNPQGFGVEYFASGRTAGLEIVHSAAFTKGELLLA